MKKLLLSIFLVSFIIYNLNLNSVGSGDTIPAKLLPFVVLSGNGQYFDDYIDFLQKEKGTTYFLTKSQGHYISVYPILTGVIVLPFYLPVFIYLKINNLASIATFYDASMGMQKITASILASLSVVLFFLLMNYFTKNKFKSLLFAFIFAFATQTFSVSSQGLWQHGTGNLFLIISQIFLLKAMVFPHKKKIIFYRISLLASIASVWSRLIFFPFLFFNLVFILIKEKQERLNYTLITVLGLLLLFAYNLIVYHSVWGGYGANTATFNLNNFFNGLSGLLFSPARGVVFYTPVFIFGIISIFLIKKIIYEQEKIKNEFYLNYIYLISVIFIYSFWGNWWGGFSWGSRLLTDASVPAVICAYFFYNVIKSSLVRIIFYIVIIYSFFIQLIGVFNYTHSYWDLKPTNVDENPNRLWDFGDNPIFRSLKVGPDLRGINMIQNKLKI